MSRRVWDSIVVPCDCGGLFEWQSPAGNERTFAVWRMDNVPDELLLELAGESNTCLDCRRVATLYVQRVGFRVYGMVQVGEPAPPTWRSSEPSPRTTFHDGDDVPSPYRKATNE